MDYKQHVRIDLHIHSTASDGTLTPAEIITLAQELELGAISITDHDSIAGSRDALRAGIPDSLEFLTGVEISAAPPPAYPGRGSFHILGYAIQLDNPVLNRTLERLVEARLNRNPEILNRLKAMGIPLDAGELIRVAGGGQPGRPHIAMLMVQRGVVASINDAFDHYLGNGKPAYVDKYRTPCSQAIETIKGAGGIPVVAHPGLLDIENGKPFEYMIAELKEMGIEGLEVYYSGHTPEQTHRYEQLARQFDLLMTGGTDFHGDIQPDIQMGSGSGNLFISYELYEKLLQR